MTFSEKPCTAEQKEIIKTCDIHGDYISSVLYSCGVAFESGCPSCRAAEQELLDKSLREKEAAKRLELYARCNIEPEFYGATLENFTAATPSQQKALAAVQNLVSAKRGTVLLLGKNGVGKTHLACAALKTFARGAIYSMYEISARIRQTYGSGATETELSVTAQLASLPFLIIDEVGRTKGSDAEKNWLSYVLDKRHTRSLPTMVLSNRLPARSLPRNQKDEAIELFFGNDIISRFKQSAIIVEVDAPDYRESLRGVDD